MNVDENGRLTTFRLNGRNDEHVPVGKNTQANRKKWWNKKKLGNRCGNARALRVCFVFFGFFPPIEETGRIEKENALNQITLTLNEQRGFIWATTTTTTTTTTTAAAAEKKDKKRKSRRYLRQVRGKAGPLSSLGWRHRKISVNEIKLTSKWAWSVPR